MPPTLEECEAFVYDLPNQFPSVQYAVVNFIRLEPFTAVLRAEIYFEHDIMLRVREALDFDEGFIQSYSYEVYQGDEKLYWYDSWPHPQIPELAATNPHHKHLPPDIKHNRVPAPDLSFDQPNLPFLIREIEQTLLSS